MRFEVIDPRDRDDVGLASGPVRAESGDVVCLFPVLRNLRLDDAAVVIEAGRELVVREVVLHEKLALDEGADVLRVVVEVQARDDLLVVGEAAELGGQIGTSFRELAVADGQTDVSRQTQLPLLFVDDVDDAGHSGGVETCRRVVNDLDRFDVGRGHAVESALIAEACQARLPTVDKDRDLVTPAQRNLAVLVNGHAREVLHCIEQRAGGLRGSLVEPEHACIESGCPYGVGRNRDLLSEALQTRQADVAEVVRLVELTDQEVGYRREVPWERRRDPVLSGCQTLDEEATVFASQRAGQPLARIGLFHYH